MKGNNILEFYKGKRVFVTGHTGFKGTWLSKILVSAGADVLGYALEPKKNDYLFALSELEKDMISVLCDIRDIESLKKAMTDHQPEILFHLAAQPLVRESYKEPVITYSTNVMGTVNMLESVKHCKNIRSVVNITTDKVYYNKEHNEGYAEDDALCGQDPYSNSKSCSELITHSYRKSFFSPSSALAISTARAGNVIGGGDFAIDRIVPDCIRAAINNQVIIVRNPESVRPYQHVVDCLSGYLALAKLQYEDKVKYEGSYNFGPEEDSCISTGKLVEIFCNKWGNGQRWETKFVEGPHEATFLKLDISKAKSTLQWEPKWDINKAVDKTVEWTKTFNNGDNTSICMLKQINEYFND